MMEFIIAVNYFRKNSPTQMFDRLLNKYASPAGIYMFKANNINTATRCEICLELTIKTPERRHCCL